MPAGIGWKAFLRAKAKAIILAFLIYWTLYYLDCSLLLHTQIHIGNDQGHILHGHYSHLGSLQSFLRPKPLPYLPFGHLQNHYRARQTSGLPLGIKTVFFRQYAENKTKINNVLLSISTTYFEFSKCKIFLTWTLLVVLASVEAPLMTSIIS